MSSTNQVSDSTVDCSTMDYSMVSMDYSMIEQKSQELFGIPVEEICKHVYKLRTDINAEINTKIQKLLPDFICLVLEKIHRSLKSLKNYNFIISNNISIEVEEIMLFVKQKLHGQINTSVILKTTLQNSIKYILNETARYFENIGFNTVLYPSGSLIIEL